MGLIVLKANDIFELLANYEPSILGEENYNKYSLLIPLIEKNNKTHLLFEVRSLTMRSQPGDVCFPGGRVDQSDRDEMYSALRETEEELGLHQSVIENIAPLDYIVSDFGRIVYPFVGEIKSIKSMDINKHEVAEVFTVPLEYFLNNEPDKYKIDVEVVPEKNFPYHLIHGGKNYDWTLRSMDELFYNYNGRIIWGLTARIVKHFVSLLQTKGLR